MSLQFNVSQLLKADIGQTREYEFDSSDPIDLGDGVASDIAGSVKFTLTNFGVLAAGHVHAVLHLSCARCLEAFQTPAEVDFEEQFQPSIDISTGLPSSAPRSDTAFLISQSHTIDLGEPIRQSLLLAVELIPVCREDCAGLCPTCGANRNVEACRCAPDESDSPFAVLQGLLKEASGE